jgi:hypothetical protein
MNDELFWAMTAASIFGISHHPKNYSDGFQPMSPEQAGKLADDLLVEFRKRVISGYFNDG